jgi:hypothetical protein
MRRTKSGVNRQRGGEQHPWKVSETPCGHIEIHDDHGRLAHRGKPLEIGQYLSRFLCVEKSVELGDRSEDVLTLTQHHNFMLLTENRRLHQFIRSRFEGENITAQDMATPALRMERAPCGCRKRYDVLAFDSFILGSHLSRRQAERCMGEFAECFSVIVAAGIGQVRKQITHELKFAGMHRAAKLVRYHSKLR